MSLAITTGRSRVTCPECSTEVEQQEIEVLTGKPGTIRLLESHQAPCGSWCRAGGWRNRIAIRAWREGAYHGQGGRCECTS